MPKMPMFLRKWGTRLRGSKWVKTKSYEGPDRRKEQIGEANADRFTVTRGQFNSMNKPTPKITGTANVQGRAFFGLKNRRRQEK